MADIRDFSFVIPATFLSSFPQFPPRHSRVGGNDDVFELSQ